MKVLVTGAAGFIGFHAAKALLDRGHTVVGIDNLNNYYDPALKLARLKELGITTDLNALPDQNHTSTTYKNFHFLKLDITDRTNLSKLFKEQNFDVVCHLAAQAGVRYSIENPEAYIDSNIVGFLNILECCRHNNITHLLYASSSSVYGNNTSVPFKTTDNVDHPISLYAATKKSNELMAHTYSHLFGLPTTGLRFFTVYGPWGRPDMAMFLFTEAILNGRPINVFNYGNMERDFTYVDDIVKGIVHIIEGGMTQRIDSGKLYKVYNIGNSKSVKLTDFIEAIEKTLGIKATKNLLPMQDGDVAKTWADVEDLIKDFDYCPNTPIAIGVARFIEWYREYYNHND
ncbi:MAG: NAD-dependent epimerase [Allomuricauda sp.]